MKQKTVHQVWIGHKQPPRETMNTWLNIPGWDYKLWTEADISDMRLKCRKQYSYYFKRGLYSGAVNIARLEILYRYGGAYIDADAALIGNWFGTWLEGEFFAGYAHDLPNKPKRLQNAIMGANRGNKTLRLMIDTISRLEPTKANLEPSWRKTGAVLLTDAVSQTKNENYHLLPAGIFYDVDARGAKRSHNSITTHFYGTTHGKY